MSFPDISIEDISHLRSFSILPLTFTDDDEIIAFSFNIPLIFTLLAIIITSSPTVTFSSIVTVPPAKITAFLSMLELITTSFAAQIKAYSILAFILIVSDDNKNCIFFNGSFTSIVLDEDNIPIFPIDLSTSILPTAFLKKGKYISDVSLLVLYSPFIPFISNILFTVAI